MNNLRCWEAIIELFEGETEPLHKTEVVKRLNNKYPGKWKSNTIGDHLVGLSVNQAGAIHYPSLRKHAFLFCLGNMRYRRWNPDRDGLWEITDEGAQRISADVGSPVSFVEDVEEIETAAVDTSLSLERDLEKSLLNNLGQLEPNLTLYSENGIFGNQLQAGAVGRIDILCADKNSNLVVIELKAGTADDRVCGQILRYMGWVQENLARNRKVKGVIVANEFSEPLKYAAKAMSNVCLKKYDVKFEFTDI